MKLKNIHIGIVIPASNLTIERELYLAILSSSYLREIIFLHFGRAGFETRYKVSALKYLSEVVENVPYELEKLNKINIDTFSFFCTSGSVLLKENRNIQNKCKSIIKKELITPIESIVEAFAKLKVVNPLIITPYSSNLSNHISKLLENNNIKTNRVISLNLTTGSELLKFSEEKIMDLLKKEILDYSLYDSICIMCTNFPTFSIIENIEKLYNLPVITSNQATLFKILDLNNVETVSLKKFGKIFEI